ncbi:M23 family metallopeptidase [Tessaracoccus antarcticus]|uniref:M23 family metallopeptidase n=1 Tax=Tessaracoccus antarcticus TaxID=2479848 RepID=UPI0018F304AA|nr:M23 family metallopeptidase [Tessaracoccus antarcticus]
MPITLNLAYPFNGRWLTQNSPANRVPSHGTTLYASTFAIDFVPVDDSGRTAPLTLASLVYPEPAARFPGFGRSVLAPVDGIIVALHDSEPDHAAFRGLPSIRYALTQARRAAAGWLALAGNHVMIRTHNGSVVALCHLQHHSVRVRTGQRVDAGQLLAGCGNTGNSTEPHLHLQAISGVDVMSASALSITFPGGLPRNGTIIDAQ